MSMVIIGASVILFFLLVSILGTRRPSKPKIKTGSPILDEHFECSDYIQLNYKYRRNIMRLPAIIGTCERQIALAPKAAREFFKDEMESLPRHTGFDRLVRIRKSQGKYIEARRLAEEAMRQGWNGNWGKLIADCDRAMEKTKLGSR